MDVSESGRSGAGVGAAIAAGVASVVVLVAAGLLLRDRVTGVDRWALDVLQVAPGGTAGTVVSALSDGLRIAAVLAAAAAIGWLIWRGRRQGIWPASGHIALFLVVAPSSELLKDLIGRAHPGDPADYSYPSTHVAMVTVAVIITASIITASIVTASILAWPALPWRRHLPVVAAAVAAAAVVATAATRVLLAEHHLTDVAGTMLGYAGLGLAGVYLLRRPTARATTRPSAPATT